MADVCFVLIQILIGLVIILFSWWWTLCMLERNSLIPKKRGKLQFGLIFLLLWSSWFVAFAFTHRDLSNEPIAVPSEITMATYAICCVAFFAIMLVWDGCCREPPHLIPAVSMVVALVCICWFFIPGLTLLAVYCREERRYNDDDGQSHPHQEYVDKLKMKGIVGVTIGSIVDLIALVIYFRSKYVPRSLAPQGESN